MNQVVTTNEKGEKVELTQGEDNIWRRKILIPKRKLKLTTEQQKETETAVQNLLKSEENNSHLESSTEISLPEQKVEKNIKIEPFDLTMSMFTDTSDFQTRAIEILKTGVMPLCPPARRNWGLDTSLNLAVKVATLGLQANGLRCPQIDAYLRWNIFSMQLETSIMNQPVSPTTSRAFLLDKYNFLTLPGTAKHHHEKDETAACRSRFYTYQMMREIATGKIPSEAEIQQLQMLEMVKKNSPVPLLNPACIAVPL